MDLNEIFTAQDVIETALARLEALRDDGAKLIRELEQDLITQRLLHAEACRACEAMKRLLDGDIYADNGPILALEAQADEPAAVPEPAAPAEPVALVDFRLVRRPWDDEAWVRACTPEPEPKPAPKVEPEAAPIEAAPQPRQAVAGPGRSPAVTADGSFLKDSQSARLIAALEAMGAGAKPVQASLSGLAKQTGIPSGSVVFVVRKLVDEGRLEVIKSDIPREPNCYRVLGGQAPKAQTTAPTPEPVAAPPAPPPALPKPPQSGVDRLISVMIDRMGPNGMVTGSAEWFCAAAGIAFDQWDVAKGILIRNLAIRLVHAPPRPGGVWTFQLAKSPAPAPAPAETPAPRPVTAAPVELRPDPKPRTRSGPCELVDLEAGECHWPIGSGDPQLYCGKPSTPGGQYCERHASDMFAGKRSRAPRGPDSRAEIERLEAKRARWTQ